MLTSRDADFDEWVAHNRVRLHKTAFLICGDWYLADDLVQDALIRCFPRWKKITEAGDPLPYLRTTLVRLCIDHSRRPARRELPTSETYEQEQGRSPDFDRLLTALRSIPPGQRTILVLRYWDGLSIEETAVVTKTSSGNVKSQSSRGLDALKAALVCSPESEDA